MPELPEVETIRLQLQPLLKDRLIVDSGSHPSEKFTMSSKAIGHRISQTCRRGKYLIICLITESANEKTGDKSVSQDTCGHPHQERELTYTEPDEKDTLQDADAAPSEPLNGPLHKLQPGNSPEQNASLRQVDRELIIHLGMTGRLSLSNEKQLDHPHLRAWWLLDNETVLAFHDVRRFGRVYFVKAGDYNSIRTLNNIGPEPFSEQFTAADFHKAAQSSRRYIKTQLLSQRLVAGIGNIYADEALWYAHVNPVARRLSKTRAETLVDSIREVLTSALHHKGTTLRDYVTVQGHPGQNQYHLQCYGRAGKPCNRCATQLRRRVVDGRGTSWCPKCQRY
ncbi:MAG: bifunctional DNA-formamidopyrimidine glycosylase/DNA-(apurinic or apyrimidinic site) lyase [Acidimicrobiaceae bacterium]|nr:bifunctional DNA-formamidopyrimidine glycosylase/DNA-(apurinic or apyrimidinic site) lyase [Acidimicrobiaceae bacterium]